MNVPVLSAATLTLALAAGDILIGQTETILARDPGWLAPATAAARMNPLPARPELTAGGRKVFGQRCVDCHGTAGAGTSRAPSLTTTDVQAQTDGALFWKVTTGNSRDGMPAFSFLPETQRWQVVLYLRQLSREGP